MHITASGLMGWGYASARLEKRYGRLLLMFLLAVGIHGLWNGSALTAVYGALLTVVDPAHPNPLGMLVMLAGLGMLALMLPTMLTVLPLLNRRLRPAVPPAPEVIPPMQP
jgi:RsiW-degrading membrane proteinase PrsW (M82 family)